MKVQEAAKLQLGFWHGVVDGIVADCGDALNRNIEGSTITSIASIYAHIVFGEDFIVQGMLQGKQPLYNADGWDKKLNVTPSPQGPRMEEEWARNMQMDLSSFQQYAKAVFGATDSYLANVTDADLEKKVQTPIGEQNAAWAIAVILGTHAPQHTGEIAALKGVQGMKGLPF